MSNGIEDGVETSKMSLVVVVGDVDERSFRSEIETQHFCRALEPRVPTSTKTTMFSSLARRSASTVSASIQRLLPKQLPPSLSPKTGNLYEVLSRTPTGGVGQKVFQTRWRSKKIEDCYWVVTRSKFKCEGHHGKAWGHLYWKGA